MDMEGWALRRFRERFQHEQRGKTRGIGGVCVDGPLKGLPVLVDEMTWKTPGAIWTFSDYSVKESRWSVTYTHAEQAGRWKLVEVRGDARKNFEKPVTERMQKPATD